MTRISIIIPTKDRPQLLAACLDRLAPGAQTLAADQYEVIVSDDSPHGSAQKLIEERYRWVRWVKGPGRGPAANRNSGARYASGEYLAFVDDDCLPEPGWLEAILTAATGGKLDVIEGKTVMPDKVDSPFWFAVENLTGGLYWSCNLAVRQEVFEQLGGFDEDFLEPGGEDMELAWRITRGNLTAAFLSSAVVLHPARRVTWSALWWRTFLIRWTILYEHKTGQAVPVGDSWLVAVAVLVWRRTINLVRTTAHLVTRFDASCWRTRLFYKLWDWLTFPLVLPYLMYWELRFRSYLSGGDSR